MKKSAWTAVGLVALWILGMGIGYSADVKVIRIANISCMSGPCAPWGIAGQRALRMGAEDVGTFTIAGQAYRWEVVDYDHKYSPSDTLSALNKAIFSDNIRYGWIQGAGIHPPLFTLLRENNFLDIAMAAGGSKITNPSNPTVFRDMASSDQLIITFFDDVYRIYDVKRVGLIVPNDELGKEDWKILTKLHQDRKPATVIAAEEFFDRGTTDFYPALKRMLSKKIDMIFTDASPTGTVALIAKQARELGFQNVIYNPTGALEANVLWETAGKASDKVLVPRIWAEAPTQKYKELERRYREKYNEELIGLFPETYVTLPWLVEAMKKANSVDSVKVIPALAETPFKDHPFGPASWGGEKYFGIKRQIVYPMPLSILQDKKWKSVMVKESKLD